MDERDLVWEKLGLADLLGNSKPLSLAGKITLAEERKSDALIGHRKMLKKPAYNVLMKRYDNIPHKPTRIHVKKLDRLADPLRGKYQKYYDNEGSNDEAFSNSPKLERKNDYSYYSSVSPILKKDKVKTSNNDQNGGFFLTEAWDQNPEDNNSPVNSSPIFKNRKQNDYSLSPSKYSKNVGIKNLVKNQLNLHSKIKKLKEPILSTKKPMNNVTQPRKIVKKAWEDTTSKQYGYKSEKFKKIRKSKKIDDNEGSNSSLERKGKLKPGFIRDHRTLKIKKVSGSGYGKKEKLLKNEKIGVKKQSMEERLNAKKMKSVLTSQESKKDFKDPFNPLYSNIPTRLNPNYSGITGDISSLNNDDFSNNNGLSSHAMLSNLLRGKSSIDMMEPIKEVKIPFKKNQNMSKRGRKSGSKSAPVFTTTVTEKPNLDPNMNKKENLKQFNKPRLPLQLSPIKKNANNNSKLNSPRKTNKIDDIGVKRKIKSSDGLKSKKIEESLSDRHNQLLGRVKAWSDKTEGKNDNIEGLNQPIKNERIVNNSVNSIQLHENPSILGNNSLQGQSLSTIVPKMSFEAQQVYSTALKRASNPVHLGYNGENNEKKDVEVEQLSEDPYWSNGTSSEKKKKSSKDINEIIQRLQDVGNISNAGLINHKQKIKSSESAIYDKPDMEAALVKHARNLSAAFSSAENHLSSYRNIANDSIGAKGLNLE